MINAEQKEREVFLAALKLKSPEERAALLQGACLGNPDLLKGVEKLFAAHEQSWGPLDAPPADALTPTIGQQELDEKPGTEIGPYKLLQKLGEGGMGVVYMAEQSRPVSRRVALKIIKPGMDSGQVIARFEAERQALAMMDHPNIAKVLDAGATDTGLPYFVMELVKGIPITQFCDEQHLSTQQRLELFVRVCNAIQHAHQKGIVHRDLKPTNVLVAEYDQQAVPKVIDFGVAKATSQKLTEKTMFTQFGQIVGTLEYMSPEQAKLNQLDIDTRSDVYSLGVLLYELLTGDTPFDRKRLRSAAFEEMLRIIREEEPPKPSIRLSSLHDRQAIAKCRSESPERLDKLVRGDLDWITMKALEKDRGRRYATASNLADDLQRFLRHEVIEARPPTRGYQLRKFVGRNKGPVAAMAGVFLALFLGLVAAGAALIVANNERIRANENEAQARDEALSATRANQRALEMIMQDALAFALSGDKERTENFIERAQEVGAELSQLELIRAALLQGTDHFNKEVHRKLRRVVEMDPENITARVLLAFGYLDSSHLQEYMDAIGPAMMLPPKTGEDYIMRSYAMHFFEAGPAVKFAEKGLEEHDSGLARYFYSRALGKLGLLNNDSQIVGEALKQARASQLYLGNASLATQAVLQAVDRAFLLARREGESQAVLEKLAAEGDLAAERILSSTGYSPYSLLDCAGHYEFVRDNIPKASEIFELGMRSGFGIYTNWYVSFKLRHEGPAAALRIFERLDAETAEQSLLLMPKGFLLALSGQKEAANNVLGKLEKSSDFSLALPSAALIPLILGDRDKTMDYLESAKSMPFLPTQPSVEMTKQLLLGQRSADLVLKEVDDLEDLASAHYFLAVKAFAEENWQAAREHFVECQNVWYPFTDLHVDWSMSLLAQMDRESKGLVGPGAVSFTKNFEAKR